MLDGVGKVRDGFMLRTGASATGGTRCSLTGAGTREGEGGVGPCSGSGGRLRGEDVRGALITDPATPDTPDVATTVGILVYIGPGDFGLGGTSKLGDCRKARDRRGWRPRVGGGRLVGEETLVRVANLLATGVAWVDWGGLAGLCERGEDAFEDELTGVALGRSVLLRITLLLFVR